MIIAVCDDNSVFLDQMKPLLEEIPYVEKVLMYSNYEVLQANIHSFFGPDLVIMDMEWNRGETSGRNRHSSKENGMVLAEDLLQFSPKTQILYVTGYLDHFAQRMFLHKANVVGLLHKPVDKGLLRVYLDRVQKTIEDSAEKEKYLLLKKRHETINVRYEDIYYIESTNHVIHLVMDKLTIDLARSLESLLEELPEHFIRCHKSYVVNLNQVVNVSRSGLSLKDRKETIPIGRSYYDETRRRFVLKLAENI